MSAHITYSVGPEYPEYVMHVSHLRNSPDGNIRIFNALFFKLCGGLWALTFIVVRIHVRLGDHGPQTPRFAPMVLAGAAGVGA